MESASRMSSGAVTRTGEGARISSPLLARCRPIAPRRNLLDGDPRVGCGLEHVHDDIGDDVEQADDERDSGNGVEVTLADRLRDVEADPGSAEDRLDQDAVPDHPRE